MTAGSRKDSHEDMTAALEAVNRTIHPFDFDTVRHSRFGKLGL